MRNRKHIQNNMRAVRNKDSKIEIKMGKALWAANLRYRKQYEKLPGRPDFVLVNHKIAIFCDSHFWHGYNWKERKKDHKTNRQFWFKKIERNIQRDKEINDSLLQMGWKVIRFWEHEIKENVEICVKRVKEEIK